MKGRKKTAPHENRLKLRKKKAKGKELHHKGLLTFHTRVVGKKIKWTKTKQHQFRLA